MSVPIFRADPDSGGRGVRRKSWNYNVNCTSHSGFAKAFKQITTGACIEFEGWDGCPVVLPLGLDDYRSTRRSTDF